MWLHVVVRTKVKTLFDGSFVASMGQGVAPAFPVIQKIGAQPHHSSLWSCHGQ
eukprot:m.185201 g.185201  ORF g.185201 m.185201 type:complete len:53 (-) comp14726_c0_seq1:39-197(-)